MCECGHLAEEHHYDQGRCYADHCTCEEFVEVILDPIIQPEELGDPNTDAFGDLIY
jgi:hypothetical protein